MLEFSRGDSVTVLVFLLFWAGIPVKICWPLDLHPRPKPRADALGWGMPLAAPTLPSSPATLPDQGPPQPWPESSGHLESWAMADKSTGRWMLCGPLGTGELVRSWLCLPCKWNQMGGWLHLMQIISCFLFSCLDVNKNKPRKTLIGVGRSSMLVKKDNPRAVSRGRRG